MKRADSVTATTLVSTGPATAFELFTREIDDWWKHGRRFRPSVGDAGVLHFEPRVGGRLLETYADGTSFVFGNQYDAYARRTGRLLPRVKRENGATR
jgi:hypothetical protein